MYITQRLQETNLPALQTKVHIEWEILSAIHKVPEANMHVKVSQPIGFLFLDHTILL